MQNLKSTLERKTSRCQPKLSKKSLTDQSFKKSCDINNIVKQFNKTGRLPESTKAAQYGDFTQVPTLEEAFKVSIDAAKAFYELPSQVRKLLNNDPSELESFILNEDNEKTCLKYGLIKAKPKDQVIPVPADIDKHDNINAAPGDSNANTSD